MDGRRVAVAQRQLDDAPDVVVEPVAEPGVSTPERSSSAGVWIAPAAQTTRSAAIVVAVGEHDPGAPASVEADAVDEASVTTSRFGVPRPRPR